MIRWLSGLFKNPDCDCAQDCGAGSTRTWTGWHLEICETKLERLAASDPPEPLQFSRDLLLRSVGQKISLCVKLLVGHKLPFGTNQTFTEHQFSDKYDVNIVVRLTPKIKEGA